MGRKRRPVSDSGYLICKPDKQDVDTWHAVHITDFYGVDNPPLTFWKDPVTGDEFGRPSGYCKDHTRTRARESYRPAESRHGSFSEEEEALLQDVEIPTIEPVKVWRPQIQPSEGADEEPLFPERK